MCGPPAHRNFSAQWSTFLRGGPFIANPPSPFPSPPPSTITFLSPRFLATVGNFFCFVLSCTHRFKWRPKLGSPSAARSPGRLRATVSMACGLQGAAQGRSLRGYWLCRQAAGRGAKAREAAKQSKADQREAKAEMLGPREDAGTALARRRARSLTKVAASVLQRPPSSRARTTSACIGQTAGAEGRCAP